MSLIRRRYYFWLLKEYLKRWKKTIITSLISGGIFFFLLVLFLNFYVFPVLEKKVKKVGYYGVYTVSNLPQKVLSDVSYGLTRIAEDGSILPAASFRWEIKKGGKEYIFYLKKGQYFHNNKELTAKNLNYNFKEIKKSEIDTYAVRISLKEPYAPFLEAASRPILGNKFSGLGEFKVKKMDINGGFVSSISLQSKNNASIKKIILFYPSQEALKTAYALGDINEAIGIADTKVGNTDVSKWPNTKTLKKTNYDFLLTLFYNNNDNLLSNKKVRQALGYALPSVFSKGERAYSPIRPSSVFFTKTSNYGISDISIARKMILDEKVQGKTIEISTQEDYVDIAKIISKEWSKIGIRTKVKVVSSIPNNFQALIYRVTLPEDPDQYTLWHSNGTSNIIHYTENKRIDKLLEDGRSISDIEKRINIYSDFQKYLIDDSPASFLYFPYEYDLIRK